MSENGTSIEQQLIPSRNAIVTLEKENGIIHKSISTIFDYGFGAVKYPSPEDLNRHVGDSIKFLINPRWGIRDMLPPKIDMEIKDNPKVANRCEAKISMTYIKGQDLSEIKTIPHEVALQLAYFLNRCASMACTTKLETGQIIIPDILGGVRSHPHNRFHNFIVEEDTQKLYFIDMFPLAYIPSGLDLSGTRNRYLSYLREAGESLANREISEQTENLIINIQDNSGLKVNKLLSKVGLPISASKT